MKKPGPTQAIVFPFDLYGGAGTGAGAQLIGDALREMLADNRRESRPTRSRSYQRRLRLKESVFDKPADHAAWRDRGRRLARTALARGEFLLWLGGNHLSVLPVLEELGARAGSVCLQLDAHLDVYDLADCTTELSHGNFLRSARSPLPPIVHVGHRDLFLPAAEVAKHFRATYSAQDLALAPAASLRSLALRAAAAERLWIDIDCDVIDPAYFPAVDGPLPMGLAPPLLLRLLDAVWSERVVGVSFSEFTPARDRRDQSLELLVWLIEWMLLRRYEGPQAPGRDEEE